MMLARQVRCPYCGELFEIGIDTSVGTQAYIEDCYVCCQPISFRTVIDFDGNLTAIEIQRNDD